MNAPHAQGTGITLEAVHKFGCKLDRLPPDGEHLWIYVAMFRVLDPSATTVHLDMENLLTIEGVGCFICEQTYEQARGKPCTGKLSPEWTR